MPRKRQQSKTIGGRMDKHQKGNNFKGTPQRDPNRYGPSHAKKSAGASGGAFGQESPSPVPAQDKPRKYSPTKREEALGRSDGGRVNPPAKRERMRPESTPTSAAEKSRGNRPARPDVAKEERRVPKTTSPNRSTEPSRKKPPATEQPRRKAPATERSVPPQAGQRREFPLATQREEGARRKGRQGLNGEESAPKSENKTAEKIAKKTARIITQEEKKAAMQKRLSFIILGIAFVAILGIAGFVLRVQAIDVLGCKRYSAEEIRTASGIALYSQIYFTDLDTAAKRIEENPYLDVTGISRAFPDTIVITVREREEKAAIFFQNLVVIIDDEGYVLSIGNRADLSGLIAVEGMQASGFSVNQRLGAQTDFYANTLVAILQALDAKGLSEKVESIDVSNPLRVCMDTLGGVEVLVGQPVDLNDKMEKLAKILPELERLGAASGTLSLSAKGDPVFSPSTTILPSLSPTPSITPSPTP